LLFSVVSSNTFTITLPMHVVNARRQSVALGEWIEDGDLSSISSEVLRVFQCEIGACQEQIDHWANSYNSVQAQLWANYCAFLKLLRNKLYVARVLCHATGSSPSTGRVV
jgi:hypothetical protein